MTRHSGQHTTTTADSTANTSPWSLNIFEEATAIHTIPVSPSQLGDLQDATSRYLDLQLFRPSIKLQGIPLVYTKVELLDRTGSIVGENPYVHLTVRVLWTLFCPRLGARLGGRINYQSKEHIGLLVLGYFAAIIPSHHLEAAYEWREETQEWWSRRQPLKRGKKATKEGEDIESENTLQIGQTLLFEVLDVQGVGEGGMLTIIGSLDRLVGGEELSLNRDKHNKQTFSKSHFQNSMTPMAVTMTKILPVNDNAFSLGKRATPV